MIWYTYGISLKTHDSQHFSAFMLLGQSVQGSEMWLCQHKILHLKQTKSHNVMAVYKNPTNNTNNAKTGFLSHDYNRLPMS